MCHGCKHAERSAFSGGIRTCVCVRVSLLPQDTFHAVSQKLCQAHVESMIPEETVFLQNATGRAGKECFFLFVCSAFLQKQWGKKTSEFVCSLRPLSSAHHWTLVPDLLRCVPAMTLLGTVRATAFRMLCPYLFSVKAKSPYRVCVLPHTQKQAKLMFYWAVKRRKI